MKQETSTQHTLQILVYYLMGKESGQSIFNNITHIGIFNPRLNKVYTYDMRNYSIDRLQELRSLIGYA